MQGGVACAASEKTEPRNNLPFPFQVESNERKEFQLGSTGTRRKCLEPKNFNLKKSFFGAPNV